MCMCPLMNAGVTTQPVASMVRSAWTSRRAAALSTRVIRCPSTKMAASRTTRRPGSTVMANSMLSILRVSAGRASDTRQHLLHDPLELAELVPAGDAQRHLVEAKLLVGPQVPHAVVGRAGGNPALDEPRVVVLGVVDVQEALGFVQGGGAVLVDVDVVVQVGLDAGRVAAGRGSMVMSWQR